MRMLTSKKIKTGIKNGFTVKDFCAKYSIKGEANFLTQLENAFPAGADEALREIRKNEKNRRKFVKKPVVAVENPIPEKEVEVTEKQADDSLDALKSTEAALSSEVIDLENQHKQLAGERRDCLNKLREKQQRVDEICAELQKLRAAYEEIARQNNEIVRQMNQISGVRSEKLSELISVREQIARLETTTIAVYKDGKLEVVEGPVVPMEVDEEAVSNLAHQLMENKICEDLTIKQVRLLAKVFLIAKNSPTKLGFMFDSSALEKAYASKPLPI